MIQLSGAGKRYGHKLLFENADWLITPESRIGLVGANGTGKSTIMKILAGSESLDYGSISRAKGISTGYLPQDGLTLTGRTIFAECMSVFDELHAIEKEMESLTRSMSELDHAESGILQRRRPLPEARTRIRRPRRLHARSPGRSGSHRSRLSPRRLDAPDRRIFRRLADAHRARQTSAAEAQPAAARRAHQPSRSRSPQLAGGVPDHLSLRVRPHLARPLLSRHHRQTHRRNLEQADALLRRQLRPIPGRQRPRARSSSNPPTKRSATASSSSKSSSTASAIRRPRPSRCRAASKSWKKWSASRFRKKRRPSTFPFRSPSRAGASSPSSPTSPKVTASAASTNTRSSTKSTS